MKVLPLAIAILALAFPVALLMFHPSTGLNVDWKAGERPTAHAKPQRIASR